MIKVLALLGVLVFLPGCVSVPVVEERHSCVVQMTLLREAEVQRYCAAISDNPLSGACVIREVMAGGTTCSVVSPAPASQSDRTNLYYLGAAIYKCCRRGGVVQQ